MRQEDLARLAGIAQSTVSKLERTGHPPDLRVALRLARALGADVESLFGHLERRVSRRRVRAAREAGAEAAE